MTVYYVDPYLNASVGGIQGTNPASARTGTWTDPFNCFDILTSAAGITSINGITLASGDEIRLKGLASIDSFVYGNIRTLGLNSYRIRSIPDVADQTIFSNWKAALGATGISTNNRGVFFISDTDHTFLYENIVGTDIPKGLYFAQTNNSTVNTSIQGYNSSAFTLAGIWGACQNSSCQMYIKLVDPQYIVKNVSNFARLLSIDVSGVKISAGWTSESTQDGQTILPILSAGTHASFINHDSVLPQISYDLGRLHLFFGGYSVDYSGTVTKFFKNAAYNTTHYFGTIATANYTNWSYTYFNNNSSVNTVLKIGSMGDYYQMLYHNTAGLGNAFYVANYYTALSPYVMFTSQDKCAVYYGNMFTFTPYSASGLAFSASSSSSSVLTFLNNSYLYAYQSQPLVVGNYLGTIVTAGPNIYNYKSSQFTTALPNLRISEGTTGPIVFSVSMPNAGGSSSTYSVTAVNSSWTDNVCSTVTPININLSTFNYGQINGNIGVLDTQLQDYKAINPTFTVAHTAYLSSDTWADVNMHFGSNTYDRKPIGTFLKMSTALPAIYTPLICYNDSANNLVVQCNSNAEQGMAFVKKVSLGYVDPAGKSSMGVVVTIEKNSPFSTTSPILRILYRSSSGNMVVGNLSVTLNGNVYTYIANIATSSLWNQEFHLGLSIGVYNSGGYENTYTIKDIGVDFT